MIVVKYHQLLSETVLNKIVLARFQKKGMEKEIEMSHRWANIKDSDRWLVTHKGKKIHHDLITMSKNSTKFKGLDWRDRHKKCPHYGCQICWCSKWQGLEQKNWKHPWKDGQQKSLNTQMNNCSDKLTQINVQLIIMKYVRELKVCV